MDSIPENDRQQAPAPASLADALGTLVATHGIRAVVAALSTLCRWKAHHLRSAGNPGDRALANAWERAGTTLAWDAAITLRDLDRPERPAEGGA